MYIHDAIRVLAQPDIYAITNLYQFLNPDDPPIDINDESLRVWQEILENPSVSMYPLINVCEVTAISSTLMKDIPNVLYYTRVVSWVFLPLVLVQKVFKDSLVLKANTISCIIKYYLITLVLRQN